MFANNNGMSDLEQANKAWLAGHLSAIAHGERGKVASAAGVSPTQLSRMANIDPKAPPKNTQNIPLSKLHAFAEYFKDTPPGLAAGSPAKPDTIRPAGPEPSTVEPAPDAPRLSQFGDYDVEVRGITAGGSTESEFQFDGKVVGEVRRPPGAAKARGLFALHVAGNSMVEKYEPGDLIFLQESRHAEPGDYVVVELYPEQEGEPGKSFLKKLVRRTGRRVVCKQLNPPKEIEFDAGEVKQIYRVLKNRELFG